MSVRIALALMLLAATPVFATEPQVGRWAVSVQNCSSRGDTQQSAPLTVTPTSVSWAAEYCTVGKMYKLDRALYIEGRCSRDGIMTRHSITLAMKGERLAVTWNGAQTEMQRCP